MNGKKLLWFLFTIFVSNQNIFAVRYHRYQYEPFREKLDSNRNEKRSAVLIALGVAAVAVAVSQKANKCKDSQPSLAENVKLYDKKVSEYESLRDTVNLDWNGVVDIQGYVSRINASAIILTKQLETFFKKQYNMFSIVDSNFTAKLDETNAQLWAQYEGLTEVAFKDYVLGYQKSSGFSTKLLVTATELLGTSVHIFQHQMTHALKVAIQPKGGLKIVISLHGANTKLSKVNSMTGSYNAITGKRLTFLQTKVAVTKFVSSAATGVLILVSAASLAWQIWSYEKKCAEYAKKAQEAVDKISEAITEMKQIQSDIAAIKQNGTAVYNEFVGILNGGTIQDSIEALINYTQEAGFSSDQSTTILTILNDYKANLAAKTIAEREKLLTDVTSTALPLILKNVYCVEEKLKAVTFMRLACGSGDSNLNDLYTLANSGYTSSGYSCGTTHPLDKTLTIQTAESNLQLYNKSTTCLLNKVSLVSNVCNLQRYSSDYIATQLNQPVADVNLVLPTCSKISVPLPTGQTEICTEKENKMSVADVQSKFSFWIPGEVLSIYNACPLSATQESYVCAKRGELLSTVQAALSNYDATIVQTAYNACPLDFPESEKTTICAIKSAGGAISIIQTASDYEKMRQVYGLSFLEGIWNACS